MTTIAERPTLKHPEPVELYPDRKRWTRKDCEFLERVGMLPERYELIDGEIIEKVGQNQPHVITSTLLLEWLIGVFGGKFVLGDKPIDVADPDRPNYAPVPDVAVVRKPITAYMANAPGPGDVLLVAEVADTSLPGDLSTKADVYARAGFPEYWVLDVRNRQLFAHRRPVNGVYADVFLVAEDESIAPEAAADHKVRLADLLPPAAETAA